MPTVRSHDLDIYYEVTGDGPPLLFAHGAGGNTLIWWQQVPHFAKRYRVITFDHRAFGRSTAEGDVFFPEFFADDVRAILDAEGVDRTAVICQSMGGWTGVQLARTSPERVACLLLSGTPGGIFTEAVLQGTVEAGAKVRAGATLLDMVAAPGFPAREPQLAFLYQQLAELNPRRDPEKLARLAAISTTAEDLTDWKIPTRFIMGEHDAFWSPERMKTAADLVPGAEFSVVEGSGHSPYYELAGRFNALAEAFLNAHYA